MTEVNLGLYILDGKTPVACDDLIEWAKASEKTNHVVRRSKLSARLLGIKLSEIKVSTVFLGINHQWGEGEPLLFETRIFGGPLDGQGDRCSTWDAAEKMHEAWCEKVKNAKAYEYD